MATSMPATSDAPAHASEPWLEYISNAFAGTTPPVTETSDMETTNAVAKRRKPLLMQRVDHPVPAEAALQAREDIAKSADGLAFVFAGAPNSFGSGLPSGSDALRGALEHVPLEGVHLRVDVHPNSRASIDWLAELLQEKQVDPSGIHLSFGVDPASLFAGTGQLRMSIEAIEASLPPSLGGFFALSLPGILLEADGRVAHNAGATPAQELGIMLASAASHLRMFEQARQPLVYATPHLGFALSVDQDVISSTAKIRALRVLWARMLSEYGTEITPVSIHAETSFRMLSARDPGSNIARTTMAVFAATLGEVTSISALPHTLPQGLPDADARRIARNMVRMLDAQPIAEAFGSTQSEVLQDLILNLCQDAWEEFQRIEAEGGMLRSLTSGAVQKRIAQSRHVLHTQLVHAAAGQDTTTGIVTALRKMSPDISNDAAVTCEPLVARHLETLLAEG